MVNLPKIIDNKRKVFIDLFNDLLPQYKKHQLLWGIGI